MAARKSAKPAKPSPPPPDIELTAKQSMPITVNIYGAEGQSAQEIGAAAIAELARKLGRLTRTPSPGRS